MADSAGLVAIEKRIESEWSLRTFAGGRRRIGSTTRIEHARFARLRRGGIARDRCGSLRRRERLRRGGRRQIERALAAAACKRKRGQAQHDKGPSPVVWAVKARHAKIPNAAAPYKD